MDVRRLLHPVSKLFSIQQLVNITSQKIILPFYHTISDNYLPHVSNLYKIKTVKEFEKDIEYLCKHFKPVSIDELVAIVYQQKALTQPIFHLTFDDGFNETYTIVAPILQQKGIPATIFANTDFVDNKELFYRCKVSLIIKALTLKKHLKNKVIKILNEAGVHGNKITEQLLKLTFNQTETINLFAKELELDFEKHLIEQQPYLTTQQIKHLIKQGFSIGSHSLNHPHFKHIGIAEQKRQIKESFKYLSNNFNINQNYFSFPFSDEGVNAGLFNWMYEEMNCKLSFGISGLKKDFSKFHLHRIPFEAELKEAEHIIKSEYFYYYLKSFLKKNTINRK